MSDRIEGKIAAILDNTTVVINRGSQHGVTRGDIFYIYTKIGPFQDPDTGEDLGETTRIWGKVQATILEDKFCVARTQYSLFNIPENLFGPRIQLPIDESDITRHLEKIKIGFPVISEKSRTESKVIEGKLKELPSDISSQIIEDLVQDLADELADSDDQVVGAMAQTNALGYGLDFYEILSYDYDADAQEIVFEAQMEFSGDQDQDKPYCGDKITVKVSGIIRNIENKWNITSHEILSCDINW